MIYQTPYHHLHIFKKIGWTHLHPSKNTPQKSSHKSPLFFLPVFFCSGYRWRPFFFCRPLEKFPQKNRGQTRPTPQLGKRETHALILQFNDTNYRAHSQSVHFQLPKVHQHQDGKPHRKAWIFFREFLFEFLNHVVGFSGLKYLEHFVSIEMSVLPVLKSSLMIAIPKHWHAFSLLRIFDVQRCICSVDQDLMNLRTRELMGLSWKYIALLASNISPLKAHFKMMSTGGYNILSPLPEISKITKKLSCFFL